MTSGSSHAPQAALSLGRPSGPLGCAGCFGYLLGFGFFSLFAAAGLMILSVGTLIPGFGALQAIFWTETPCTIRSSEVVGQDTFAVAIAYDYEFDQKHYQGNRYNFFTGRTSGRPRKQAIVDRYPAGSQTVCYVDPQSPDQAVLSRAADWSLAWGLLGLPFLAVGLIGLWGMFSSRRKPAALQTPDDIDLAGRTPHDREVLRATASPQHVPTEFDDEELEISTGPAILHSTQHRMGTFFGLLVISLFWNGVMAIFVSTRLPDWLHGKWQWMPELIIFPFLVIGLLLILAALHALLALFNPLPVLTLSQSAIPLGGSATLSWRFQGSPRSIRRLRIKLKATEEATYTRGTDTHTDVSAFHDEALLETREPLEIEQGTLTINIPANTMHSLTGNRNKIIWQILFQADIPLWPDVSSTFTFRVVPQE